MQKLRKKGFSQPFFANQLRKSRRASGSAPNATQNRKANQQTSETTEKSKKRTPNLRCKMLCLGVCISRSSNALKAPPSGFILLRALIRRNLEWVLRTSDGAVMGLANFGSRRDWCSGRKMTHLQPLNQKDLERVTDMLDRSRHSLFRTGHGPP